MYYSTSTLAMFCNAAKFNQNKPCYLQEYRCVHTSSPLYFSFDRDPPYVQTTFCPETTSKSQLQWPKGHWLGRRERCPSYRSVTLPAESDTWSWKPNLCHCSHKGHYLVLKTVMYQARTKHHTAQPNSDFRNHLILLQEPSYTILTENPWGK